MMDKVHLVLALSRFTVFTMAFPRKTNTSAIIAAAIDLLEREGEAALTLRRVSSLLGVTPNALYRYYRSRDVLVAATADEVARRMLETIDIAIADAEKLSEAKDEARVRVLTAVYADFADMHPNLYRTLMTAKASAAVDLPMPQYHDLLWAKVVDVLESLTGRDDAPAAAVTLWSLLHGVWALKQAGRLGGVKPDNIEDFAVDVFIKGLRR